MARDQQRPEEMKPATRQRVAPELDAKSYLSETTDLQRFGWTVCPKRIGASNPPKHRFERSLKQIFRRDGGAATGSGAAMVFARFRRNFSHRHASTHKQRYPTHGGAFCDIHFIRRSDFSARSPITAPSSAHRSFSKPLHGSPC
jgi:hypothetical protein